VKNVLSGIAYLHENRIVHRTLNSYKILLSTEDRQNCLLKIGGLCNSKQILGSMTRSNEVSAVQSFLMSPETINGSYSSDFQIGRKTDIWNFGLLLIEMLTGAKPRFIYRTPDGKTERQCVTSQEIMFFVGCGGRPQILNTWPDGWRQMIQRCLQVNPVARPSAAKLLNEISVTDQRGFGSRLIRSDSAKDCLLS
jgi:serine/threonine protein kinase